MIRKLRQWMLTILPMDTIRWIRSEIIPRYRALTAYLYQRKLSNVLKKASLTPNSVEANMEMGWLYYKLGQLEEAIQCYEKVIALDPDLLQAYLQLELLLRLSGQKGKQDNKGNRLFDHRTYDLENSFLQKLLNFCQKMVKKFPESLEANLKTGNALIMAHGDRERAGYFFQQAAKAKFQQARLRGSPGLIFVASLPRSGSGYMKNSLIKGLGLSDNAEEAIPITKWWFPDIVISAPEFALSTQLMPEGVIVDHPPASPANLTALNICLDRLIVNVRDPRQALLSWVHYMNYFRYTNNIEGLLESQIPKDYFLLSQTEQIGWQIDNFYLPVAIKWIEGWLDAQENPLFYPKILIATHENLVADPIGYFESILEFYEIEKTRFIFPEKPEFRQKTHIRKGRVDEWKEVFTSEQAERASAMIPERLFRKFGWVRDPQLLKV